MTEREATRTISKSWELPHPPAKVWRALTEPALIAQWLMPTDMSLEIGKSFTFRGEPAPWWDGMVHSQIRELEPQKRLSYTWGAGAMGLESVVTWTLSAIPGGTRLELEHSGFKAEQSQAFAGAGLGWERNIGERMRGVLSKLT